MWWAKLRFGGLEIVGTDFVSGSIECRGVAYPLVVSTEVRTQQLARFTGAWRWEWNGMLDLRRQCHEAAPPVGAKTPYQRTANPDVAFTQLRKALPWLQELPHAPFLYVLKYQAELGRSVLAAVAGGVCVRGRRPYGERGLNAVRNIPAPGTGASARREALALAASTSREMDAGRALGSPCI